VAQLQEPRNRVQFGYLVPDGGATPRPGGGRHITELDVFEITATPTPMNNQTHVLSTKSIDAEAEDFNRVREPWRTHFAGLMAAAAPPMPTLREKSLKLAAEHMPVQVPRIPLLVPARAANASASTPRGPAEGRSSCHGSTLRLSTD
jgi:hypothetical protein